MKRTLAGVSVLAWALVTMPAFSGSASAQSDTRNLTWTASVDGQKITSNSGADEVTLHAHNSTRASLSVTNVGKKDVAIRSVRFEGRILGLAFYVFTTRIELRLPPGKSAHVPFELDMADLDGQATGLIPSQVLLLGEENQQLAGQNFTADVNGSLWSTYGIFGLAVAGMTIVTLAGAILGLAVGWLSSNRWRRATAFAVPGLGLGFTLTFTLSALGWAVPSPRVWLLCIVLGGAVGFVAGYLTPTPDIETVDRSGRRVPSQIRRRGRVGADGRVDADV